MSVRGQRAIDDQLTARCQRPRHVSTHLTADTIDRLEYPVVACNLGYPFAQVLVLRADHRGAPEREDVLDSGSAPDHVEGLEADVCSELDNQLAHRRAGRCLQEPFTRSNSEYISGQDDGRERIAEKLGCRGIAHAVWNGQHPIGIGNDIFLPRAGDSDRTYALADGETVCAAPEFVDDTDGFDSGHRRELRGESVSATDGMQIAGLNRHRCHPDPDLAGAGFRDRAVLQVQNLRRLADPLGDDRSHGSHVLTLLRSDPDLEVFGGHRI